jgi:hypothetical protein
MILRFLFKKFNKDLGWVNGLIKGGGRKEKKIPSQSVF